MQSKQWCLNVSTVFNFRCCSSGRGRCSSGRHCCSSSLTVVVVVGAFVVDPVPIRTSPNDIICGRDEIIGVKINRMQTILILKFILKKIVLVKICFRKMKFI